MPSTLILRLAVAVILLTHGVPGMFDGSIHAFGDLFLNPLGFAPFGVAIAWAIKLSHVAAAVALVLNRFVKPLGFLTIGVLLAGIALVHFPEGWYVVGGGRNGMEYNVLLICALLTIMFPHGLRASAGATAP